MAVALPPRFILSFVWLQFFANGAKESFCVSVFLYFSFFRAEFVVKFAQNAC